MKGFSVHAVPFPFLTYLSHPLWNAKVPEWQQPPDGVRIEGLPKWHGDGWSCRKQIHSRTCPCVIIGDMKELSFQMAPVSPLSQTNAWSINKPKRLYEGVRSSGWLICVASIMKIDQRLRGCFPVEIMVANCHPCPCSRPCYQIVDVTTSLWTFSLLRSWASILRVEIQPGLAPQPHEQTLTGDSAAVSLSQLWLLRLATVQKSSWKCFCVRLKGKEEVPVLGQNLPLRLRWQI